MKKALFACTTVALMAACTSASKNGYVVNGTTEGIDNGTTVILLNPTNRDTMAVTEVTDNTFTFSGVADSIQKVYAMVDRKNVALFFLEPGTITANLTKHTATGTPLNDVKAEYNTKTQAIYEDDNATDEDFKALIVEYYNSNKENAFGTELWGDLLYELTYDEMSDMLENAPQNIKNYPNNERYLKAKLAAKNTAAGSKFVDFPAKTIDIKDAKKDGLDTTLGAIVAQGKPVIVDFWASWCGPCRNEIKEYLSVYGPEYTGKVNFVGVAVWENSVDDTKKAMEELPISWPVISAGGRGEGPTDDYGIMGIPHIMLIGADGTIKARDLRGEKIKEAIEAELSAK